MSWIDLGFSADEERVYRILLTQPTTDLERLATLTGLDADRLRTALDGLADREVIKIRSGGIAVPDPRLVLGALIERVEDELMTRFRRVSGLRSEVALLHAAHAEAPSGPPEPELERVEGSEAVRARLAELSFFARHCIDAVLPGGPRSAARLEAGRPLYRRAARRGMQLRLIHEPTVLDDELNRAHVQDMLALGIRVKVARDLPERLVILDERVAVVPIDPGNQLRGALIVRHPGLVVGLLDLFHRTWEGADEVVHVDGTAAPDDDPVSAQDRRLLALLASGCTDETAAREFGISVRHLRRRIAKLMADLGSRSRFEAGVEASRRGLL